MNHFITFIADLTILNEEGSHLTNTDYKIEGKQLHKIIQNNVAMKYVTKIQHRDSKNTAIQFTLGALNQASKAPSLFRSCSFN